MAAAAAGLVISMTGKMAEPLFEERNWLVYAVAIAGFVGVGVLRWPIWWVLLVLIPAEHRNRVVEPAMKADGGILLTLAGYFALMSLFAIGGANGAMPEMHRLAVEVKGWMTDRQFADMFAIAQVTPGPNVIIVTLIGYHVAGVAGAVVTTLAMCGPACAFAVFVSRIWDRFKNARWRIAVQAGLVPVSIGLLAASALIVARAASTSWVSIGLTLVDRGRDLQADLESALDFRGRSSAGVARRGLGRAWSWSGVAPGCRSRPVPPDVMANSTEKSSRLLSASF